MRKKPDFTQVALRVFRQAVGETPPVEPEKELSQKALAGRLGGLHGGPARAEALSKKRRIAIAKKGAKARWKDKQKS